MRCQVRPIPDNVGGKVNQCALYRALNNVPGWPSAGICTVEYVWSCMADILQIIWMFKADFREILPAAFHEILRNG